jgi:hypothetical protein
MGSAFNTGVLNTNVRGSMVEFKNVNASNSTENSAFRQSTSNLMLPNAKLLGTQRRGNMDFVHR